MKILYVIFQMVGLGTESVKLDLYKHSFTSMLGRDGESWGLSYYGRLQQKGQFRPVGRSSLITFGNCTYFRIERFFYIS